MSWEHGFKHGVQCCHDWLRGRDRDLLHEEPDTDRLWTWCIAANLAIGAMGCVAFGFGDTHGLERGMFPELDPDAWYPGCERPVP